jgi:hypothetical protein
MSMESHGGIISTGENRRSWRKACPNSTLSTTNPSWTDPGANAGLHVERVGTNCLSHGTPETCLKLGVMECVWTGFNCWGQRESTRGQYGAGLGCFPLFTLHCEGMFTNRVFFKWSVVSQWSTESFLNLSGCLPNSWSSYIISAL